MKRRRLVSAAVSALAFGALIAIGPGDSRQLSIDIWLAGTAVWLAVSFSNEALSIAPINRHRLRLPVRFDRTTAGRDGGDPVGGDDLVRGDGGGRRRRHPLRFSWRWPFVSRPDPTPPVAPRSLVALEGTVLASLDNPRAFAHRLRPRLAAVADHRLRLHRGIDPTERPEAAAAALDDTAWLIDDRPTERPPTTEELTRFLDLLPGAP